MKDTPIIDAECTDVDLDSLLSSVTVLSPGRGQHYPKDRVTGEKIKYIDLISAFDIETSRHKFHKWGWQSWLYHWQLQLGEIATITGRTWASFLYLVGKMNFWLDQKQARMILYVHDLAYEFQYLAGVWHFETQDLFATDQYAPLWAMMGRIELRCSRRLANMGLMEWSNSFFHVDHPKQEGFDYDKERFPWTPLTDEEKRYCVNDVISVVECVQALLKQSGFNLYRLPLTAVGFIRKRCRDIMYLWSKGSILEEMQNPLCVYDRLRQANRGGDCYLNDYRREQLIGDVESWDRSSSYPDVICHCKFPMTRFKEEDPTMETFKFLVEHGKAVLLKIHLYKVRLRDENSLMYIPYMKCMETGFKRPVKVRLQEGRIQAAEYLEIAITDLDMELIDRYYIYDGIEIEWMMSARYGYLPQPLCDEIVRLYKKKTMLKGDKDRRIEYNYTKILLNSIYGMMSQKVIYQPIAFDDGGWIPVPIDREEEYAKEIKKQFLNYAWSVWVTAWSRYRLHEGIAAVMAQDPHAFVYADTDSVKTMTIHPDFSKINKARMEDSRKSGAFCEGFDGQVHYMGAFEKDGTYRYFRALNIKRYATVDDHDVLSIHVSGVPSEEGARVLLENGGIMAFDYGFKFYGSGQTRSIMNDTIDITITIDEHKLHITRNCCIVPIEEVEEVEGLKSWANAIVDIIHNVDYTPGG